MLCLPMFTWYTYGQVQDKTMGKFNLNTWIFFMWQGCGWNFPVFFPSFFFLLLCSFVDVAKI